MSDDETWKLETELTVKTQPRMRYKYKQVAQLSQRDRATP